MDGILWVLRTGARWKDLPACFPSPSTCWRRFQRWTEAGLWKKAWARLLRKLDRRGRIHWEEAIADGTQARGRQGTGRILSQRPRWRDANRVFVGENDSL
jgi:transposase